MVNKIKLLLKTFKVVKILEQRKLGQSYEDDLYSQNEKIYKEYYGEQNINQENTYKG